MAKTQDEDHRNDDQRKALNETATSIKKLVLELETRELEGKPLSATEIHAIARQLRVYMDDLFAAARKT